MKIPQKLQLWLEETMTVSQELDHQPWIDARKRHRLSNAHIQMARELGMNPKKFGKIDNHKQESWKAPLPEFIEDIYYKRFGRNRLRVGFGATVFMEILLTEEI